MCSSMIKKTFYISVYLTKLSNVFFLSCSIILKLIIIKYIYYKKFFCVKVVIKLLVVVNFSLSKYTFKDSFKVMSKVCYGVNLAVIYLYFPKFRSTSV